MIYLVSLCVVFADQLTKLWALHTLREAPLMPLLPFFNLHLTFNKGVSFSFLSSESPIMPWILSGLALAICWGLILWMHAEKAKITRLGLALVLGGALGNIIDRIRLGAVVDFLDVYIDIWHWPAFNLADSAICIGVACIFYGMYFQKRKQK